jgi:hypothetical protein
MAVTIDVQDTNIKKDSPSVDLASPKEARSGNVINDITSNGPDPKSGPSIEIDSKKNPKSGLVIPTQEVSQGKDS